VQAALQDAVSDSTVCLCPGTYDFDRKLSLNKLNVSVKGLGASRSDVVLDFAQQTSGDDGLLVTSDGFTIENLAVRNSPGNGIVVQEAEDVTFRNLEVSWDAGSVTENGAYAVYPVSSTRVTVEDSLVIGAADAGIYVGQCNDVIVRRNVVHGNVAGIEIENSTNAEVYENEAYDNTSGILVFVLPNLEKKDGLKTLVRDNQIHDNNRLNFAEPGTIVANVPPGTGMLILAADETEVRDNTIENNESTGVLLLSMKTVELLVGPSDDPDTDPFPEQNFVHDNVFTNNGTSPKDVLGEWGVVPLENVVWDGQIDPAKTVQSLCLGAPPFPSYRNVHAPPGLVEVAEHTTDTAEVECTLPAHPGVSF
jgi:parallel beta-helix repeat protein